MQIKLEAKRMIKIEVTNQDGSKAVIETENAVIMHGTRQNKNIRCLSNGGAEADIDIMDLIVSAKVSYIKDADNEAEKDKRLALIGFVGMLCDMEFKEMIRAKAEKIEAERMLKNPFGSMNFGRRFPGL